MRFVPPPRTPFQPAKGWKYKHDAQASGSVAAWQSQIRPTRLRVVLVSCRPPAQMKKICTAVVLRPLAQRRDTAIVSIAAVLLEGLPQALRELDLDQIEQALPKSLEVAHQVQR